MQAISKGARRALWAVLLLPLVSMMVVPFYDTSEPRYAEIARIMAQSGDWITPWFEPGLPFWGKPPLSFWAQALSMKLFGYTEFGARLPSWICLLLSNGILIAGLRSLQGPRAALIAAIIYSTCALSYISSGAVLTDPFLTLGTTLSLISFAMAAHRRNECINGTGNQGGASAGTPPAQGAWWWRYGFFLGLAIGLLAKGPLAAVLILAPPAVWSVLNRKTACLPAALPWAKGLALTAALTLPWYAMAEIKTPGFLDYFIAGEHFRRFLDPGWSGDLYGTAHRQAYGTIWLYWLQASFPWGIIMLAAGFGALRSTRLRSTIRAARKDPLFSYWLTGALFTPLFFTFSANILWTYLLPSLAGLSVIVAMLAEQAGKQAVLSRRVLFSAAGIVPLAALVLSAIVWVNPDMRNTERSLIRYAAQRDEPALPLFYYSKPPFSARFYSAGQVRELEQSELQQAMQCGTPFYLAVPKDKQKEIEAMAGKPPRKLYANKRYVLIKISPLSACAMQSVTPNAQKAFKPMLHAFLPDDSRVTILRSEGWQSGRMHRSC
ncbi:glycosyltransferase family 39 protein [Pusillimonas sp. SM2304]|uniref:ArnT family glycosyltransferase n=1 Tax=Pusillimonas sp. SM2304 TaxID=3073241 RepID=UPI002876A8C8|nr:glycosyltransferase family 39 protein [Pusillimonas sp. SM2304]MDS1140865.1 glycosyltransferase family 39 protein [Pusillimonas sp. SM2304]